MESMRSFKGYGKVDTAEDQEFKRKAHRRCILLAVSCVLFVFVVVGLVIGLVVNPIRSGEISPSSSENATAKVVKGVCSVTLHPQSCYSSLMAATSGKATTDPEELFKLSLEIAIAALVKVRKLPADLAAGVRDEAVKGALVVCSEMIDDSIDTLNQTLISLQPEPGEKILAKSKIQDVRTWLSAVITNDETCVDALGETKSVLKKKMEEALRDPGVFVSNSLAIVTKIFTLLAEFNIPIHRKLLSAAGGVPGWVAADIHRRRLFQAPPAGRSRPFPNVTVAQDGSGNYETIKEALAEAPEKHLGRFVIYVKAGRYVENVIVDKKRWNVFIYGDGAGRTIVSGSKNAVDGTPTFRTAPFIVEGRGFTAMDMGFENTAGPEKRQAVAVRTKADFTVFYRCAFDAYQDTLYTHSLRQFFRDCDIRGTVDFIFGDAAAVFQNCTIRPRQPMPKQKNTITAQGKKDPNQNTGTAVQGCTIAPFDNLTAPTFLGRPWKDYSSVVFMNSAMAAIVHPHGWLSWDGDKAPPPTIFYREHQNTGPGSRTLGRVGWKGYRPFMSPQEVQDFRLDRFIQDHRWLPSRGVQYDL